MNLSIVVTCGRTKLPSSKTIYIHRRRGGRIVSAFCRSETDLVGDRPMISPTERFVSPPSLPPDLEPPVSERNACRTAFGIPVAHRGWALLVLIIIARGTRSLSLEQRALLLLDKRSAPPGLCGAFYSSLNRREDHDEPITISGCSSDRHYRLTS